MKKWSLEQKSLSPSLCNGHLVQSFSKRNVCTASLLSLLTVLLDSTQDPILLFRNEPCHTSRLRQRYCHQLVLELNASVPKWCICHCIFHTKQCNKLSFYVVSLDETLSTTDITEILCLARWELDIRAFNVPLYLLYTTTLLVFIWCIIRLFC